MARASSDVIGSTVINNLASFTGATGPHAVVNDSGTGTVVSHNLEIDSPAFADPDNPDPLARDFALTSASPARDQGTPVNLLDDFRGARRVGLSYDVGAHEYGAPLNETLIFADSFETGSTSAWSLSVP